MTDRANPFGDLSDFPTAPAKPKPDKAVIDQVATETGFHSRQPVKQPEEPALQPEKEKLRQKVFRVTAAQDRELTKRLADLDTTMQDLVLESINALLKSKGLPPI